MFLLKLLSRLFRRKECPPHYSEKHYSSIGSTLSDDTLKNSDSECPRPTAAVNDNHTPNVPSVHLIPPRAIYDGGFDTAAARGVCLRIANGGAGQTGFIQAWADAFIQHMVAQGEKPFQVRGSLISHIQLTLLFRWLGILEIPQRASTCLLLVLLTSLLHTIQQLSSRWYTPELLCNEYTLSGLVAF